MIRSVLALALLAACAPLAAQSTAAATPATTGKQPFTIERSVKGFRLNHFLHSLTDPAVRKLVEDGLRVMI